MTGAVRQKQISLYLNLDLDGLSQPQQLRQIESERSEDSVFQPEIEGDVDAELVAEMVKLGFRQQVFAARAREAERDRYRGRDRVT